MLNNSILAKRLAKMNKNARKTEILPHTAVPLTKLKNNNIMFSVVSSTDEFCSTQLDEKD